MLTYAKLVLAHNVLLSLAVLPADLCCFRYAYANSSPSLASPLLMDPCDALLSPQTHLAHAGEQSAFALLSFPLLANKQAVGLARAKQRLGCLRPAYVDPTFAIHAYGYRSTEAI